MSTAVMDGTTTVLAAYAASSAGRRRSDQAARPLHLVETTADAHHSHHVHSGHPVHHVPETHHAEQRVGSADRRAVPRLTFERREVDRRGLLAPLRQPVLERTAADAS